VQPPADQDPDALAARLADAEETLHACPDANGRPAALRRATALFELGAVLQELGRTEEALSSWRERVEILERLPGAASAVAATRVIIARVLSDLMRYDEALMVTDSVMKPDAAAGVIDLALDLYGMRLRALVKLRRWSEAETEAATVIDRIGEERSGDARVRLSQAHWTRSKAARERGEPERAVPAIDAAVSVARAPLTEPRDPQRRAALARAMLDRPLVFEALGRRAAARAAYREFIIEFRSDRDQYARRGVRVARRRRLALLLGAAPWVKPGARATRRR
jgi:tetratricopeptide (TPR) repeat protein